VYFSYDSMTIKCNRLQDTVLYSNGSLTLPVWFTCDDIVDLFSRVCVWLYPGCMCCFLFLFSLSVSVYLVLRVQFNNNKCTQQVSNRQHVAVKLLSTYWTRLREITCHYVTQCYLPPVVGDFPAFTQPKLVLDLATPVSRGMQGWVDLGDGYIPR